MQMIFRDLIEFHRKYGCEIGTVPAIPDDATATLRARLIDEEYRELMDAMDREDLPAIAKEAIDLVYVTAGMLVAYGIFAPAAWDAVHRSNMTKDGSVRGDGKIMKGDGYRPADVASILALQDPLPLITPSRDQSDGVSAALEELESSCRAMAARFRRMASDATVNASSQEVCRAVPRNGE